jgi:UDP-N-acetylglucosamine--N-acetylmuramyl-(pentapeptide) pyrophosphoryl-undecaprenol N-acetylglucosamine transferase
VRLLLAAGGSAGHVEPALTLADSMRADDPNIDVVVLGTDRGIENTLVPPRGYPLRTVSAVPLPRSINADLLRTPTRVARSVRSVMDVLRDEKPDVVVGFGGYVALPAYLAARRMGIPVVIHEANARAGLANRVGARFTPWVAMAVAGSMKRGAVIGMPLRPAIKDLAALSVEDRADMQRHSRAALGLAPDVPTLLVFGGSLGARRLNETIVDSLEMIAAAGAQVLHITGAAKQGLPENWPPARPESQPAYVAIPYLHAMHEAFAAADVAMSRAGAMTCAELAAVGLPAVYIPLPVGNGEQALNAAPVVNAGGGVLVSDDACTSEMVKKEIIPLLADPTRRARMANAARTHAVTDADTRLADMVKAAAAWGAHSRG